MSYHIKVYLNKLTCRDTESIHSSDRFGLSGAVTTDTDSAGFIEPSIRINDHETHDFGGQLIFDGSAHLPKVGLVFQGWDIDENDSWVENEAEIIAVSKAISAGVKLIPTYGQVAGAVIDAIIKIVPPIVDQFIDWDKNDLLLDYGKWWDAPTGEPYKQVAQDVSIVFSGGDPIGYSSWDYTLELTIAGSWMPSFGTPTPLTDEQEAMQMFRNAATVAADNNCMAGFPTFNQKQIDVTMYGGKVFIYDVQHLDLNIVPPVVDLSGFRGRVRIPQLSAIGEQHAGPSKGNIDLGASPHLNIGDDFHFRIPALLPKPARVAEWRDVPLSALGDVDLGDFRGRFRATSQYAGEQGFVGGFPNFYHADYGNGVVCGTVLLNAAGAQYMGVRSTDLGSPPPNDIAARFTAVNEFAVTHGYVGGFPDFTETIWGNGVIQYGVILIKKTAGRQQYNF